MLSGLSFRVFAILGLFFPVNSRVLAAEPDLLLQKLRQLELKTFDNPTEAYKEAREMLPTLNYEQQTQPWLRAWLLSLGDDDTEDSIRDIDRYIATAEAKGLLGEKVLLMLKKAEFHESTWPREKVKAMYADAKEFSRTLDDVELLPRVLYQEAVYFLGINEIPQSLQSISEAVRLSGEWRGEREIFRYEYRSLLANVIVNDTARSLAIFEENMEWVKGKTYRSSAAAYAYNAAMVLVISRSTDDARIVRYFGIAETQAKAIGDMTREAESIAGKANYLFNQKKYEEARELFKKSTTMFKRLNNKIWLQNGLVFLAKCNENLNQLDQAEAYAEEAEAALPSEFEQGKIDLLEVRYRIAKKRHRFEKALQYSDERNKIYLKIQANEEDKQLLKLKTELGLKLEEERNAKLEIKNNSLKKENESQARELELTNRLKIIAVVLFILFGISAITTSLAVRRGRIILAAKAKIQTILDTIEEGLLTIDAHLIVKDDHSAYAQRLFPQETLSGRDIFSVLLNKAKASAEDLSVWRESLQACMGEDAIAWELNGDNLPREITLKEEPIRILSLHWQPIIKGEKIASMLLSFRDVTSMKALEKTISGERLQREMLQVRIMEILSRNFREARRLVMDLGEKLPKLAKDILQEENLPAIRRSLHTDKGAARTLGLQGLSRMIHAAEDALKNPTASRQNLLNPLEVEQLAYAKVFEDILRSPQNAQSERATNLLDVINDLLVDLDQRLQQGTLTLGGIEVVDLVVHWESKLLFDIKDILIHALSNAVDHGFLLPAQRGFKPSQVRFKIHAEHRSGGIALQITDSGAGLDWKRLEGLAKARNFVPNAQQTMADVLFLDGVSTSDQVSETSGRGVGLSAVRSICQSHQGDIRIADNPDGQGTLLDMTLMHQLQRSS